MSKTWLISDTHFGHKNMINFVDSNNNRIRPFESVEEVDQLMINNWNSLIKQGDRVYHLGDVCIQRKDLEILKSLNGRKCLIKGNHDIFKLKDYIPYFDDVRAYKVFPEQGIICSHVPIHPAQLKHRFKFNVHGHLHTNKIEDPQYINICVENTDYRPISFEDIVALTKA